MNWRALPMAAFFVLFGKPVLADCMSSIVTGIDVSASISRDELVMQIDGIGAALRSPAVLSAIQSQGCASMLVYVWADFDPVVLLPWTAIATEADAELATEALSNALRDYTLKTGTLTDVSRAMEFAWHALGQIPPTGRQVLNIVSNGEDNVAAGPQVMRDQMNAAGIVVNAVLFGPSATIDQYYHENVVTGRGRFVLRVRNAEDFGAIYRAKFLLDLSGAADETASPAG